jgi:hypothetical protein
MDITELKRTLKGTFEGLYDYRLHLLRIKQIKKCDKLSSMDKNEYPVLLAKMYEERIGHSLDWNNLRTYTEKMQWEKLYDDNPLKVQLSDKYAVRDWVKNKIGEKYLIPILGVWDRYEDIDFDTLPKQFVLKTNHGSGTNLIVKDKSKINHRRVSRMFTEWLKTDYAYVSGFELHYSKIKPKIIAEKYMASFENDLPDYKFLCFDGNPMYCRVDMGRFADHVRSVFDKEWIRQDWNQGNYPPCPNVPRPQNYDEMLEVAAKLSQGFSHVRVDLYNINGAIYFGEMTFTSGSGLEPNVPESADVMLGEKWNLDIKQDASVI